MLFEKELDKVYDKNAPEDDMMERQEEMERMREHVFSESDSDKNGLISFDEFMQETKRDEYEKDPGWETLDEEDPFTDEEFRAFEMQRQREFQDYTPRSAQANQQQRHPEQANLQHPDLNERPRGGIPGQPAYKPGQGELPGGGAQIHHEELEENKIN